MARIAIIILLVVGLSFPGLSQNETLGYENYVRVGVQSGAYVPLMNEHKMQLGLNLGLEMRYKLNDRWLLGMHLNYGTSRYYQELPPEAPDDGSIGRNNTNADLKTIHAGPLVGYSIIRLPKFNLNTYFGLSTFTTVRQHPYLETIYHENLNQVIYGTYYQTSAVTDFAFPVKIELEFITSDNFNFSLEGGFYIEPDYPIVGLHVGPHLSYTF